MTHGPQLGLNANIFMRIDISRILHNSFAITWGSSGSHNFSASTDHQLICTKRTLYNSMYKNYLVEKIDRCITLAAMPYPDQPR